MQKIYFIASLLFFCLAYTTTQAQFKPEQFDGSWDAQCEGCPEDLVFTFTTQKNTVSFIRTSLDERISWDIVGNNVLCIVTETPEQEITRIFTIKSASSEEIKISSAVIRYGAQSPPETIITLYKKKKGILTYRPQEIKRAEEPEEKK